MDKWCSDWGRELVADKYGELEKRTRYGGTYNYAKSQGVWPSPHYWLDIKPYTDRGSKNSPYEK